MIVSDRRRKRDAAGTVRTDGGRGESDTGERSPGELARRRSRGETQAGRQRQTSRRSWSDQQGGRGQAADTGVTEAAARRQESVGTRQQGTRRGPRNVEGRGGRASGSDPGAINRRQQRRGEQAQGQRSQDALQGPQRSDTQPTGGHDTAGQQWGPRSGARRGVDQPTHGREDERQAGRFVERSGGFRRQPARESGFSQGRGAAGSGRREQGPGAADQGPQHGGQHQRQGGGSAGRQHQDTRQHRGGPTDDRGQRAQQGQHGRQRQREQHSQQGQRGSSHRQRGQSGGRQQSQNRGRQRGRQQERQEHYGPLDAHSRAEVARREGSYREGGPDRGGQSRQQSGDERRHGREILERDPQGFYGGKE